MAEEIKDVVLHVYRIAPSDEGANSFVSRFLPAIGFGAYHTSLEVDGYRYSFAANAGITKTLSRNEGVPPGAAFEESIFLGGFQFNRGEINGILKKLEKFFGPTSYHLVHRNCNHFTETFATTLIIPDRLLENKKQKERLKSYPDHINRLANTCKFGISHDDDIVPCQIWEEARSALAADEKVSWNFTAEGTKKEASKSKKKGNEKKELSEKQKAILSKIRAGKK